MFRSLRHSCCLAADYWVSGSLASGLVDEAVQGSADLGPLASLEEVAEPYVRKPEQPGRGGINASEANIERDGRSRVPSERGRYSHGIAGVRGQGRLNPLPFFFAFTENNVRSLRDAARLANGLRDASRLEGAGRAGREDAANRFTQTQRI